MGMSSQSLGVAGVSSLRLAPAASSLRTFGITARYEFWMQLRRYALWIIFALLGLFTLRTFNSLLSDPNLTSAKMTISVWSSFIAEFSPLGAGLLLADRFPRDRATHMDELLSVTPAPLATRLLGKYVGATLATLLPILLVYLAGALVIMLHWHDVSVLPLALVEFVATTGVAVCFVGAFSIACTTVIWPLLYQFLFIGYWFWGNFLNPKLGIPTLNCTLLTSDTRLIEDGLFTLPPGYGLPTSPLVGWESLGALLGCAALALIATWGLLRWQTTHR